MMHFDHFADYERFKRMWEAVKIVRNVRYSLFTFGDSDMPYFLVCAPPVDEPTVSVKQGSVKITRPLIVTAANAPPQFHNFFEGRDDEDLARCLLARTARFGNMKFDNVIATEHVVTDSVEEATARIGRKLDEEEEDHVAILTAPADLGGVAVLRYCLERVAQSAPDNVTELRERGFIP